MSDPEPLHKGAPQAALLYRSLVFRNSFLHVTGDSPLAHVTLVMMYIGRHLLLCRNYCQDQQEVRTRSVAHTST